MRPSLEDIDTAIESLIRDITADQQPDGSWRYCFDTGANVDAYTIILLRTLEADEEPLIRRLHERIRVRQQPGGYWRLYEDDDEGHLASTIEAYYALLYSGYSSPEDAAMEAARHYIAKRGGLRRIDGLMTQAVLAATGQIKWPRSIASIPLEMLLLPLAFPVQFFDFSGYARVHLAPLLVMADRDYAVQSARCPDLSSLVGTREQGYEPPLPAGQQALQQRLDAGLNRLIGSRRALREAATARAESYMLDRIEADGTLYSYASSTILMVLALLALDYEPTDPLIMRAIEGLKSMSYELDEGLMIQNSPSEIWDTALLAYALQEAGLPADHPSVRSATDYVLRHQHTKPGDWQLHNPAAAPGGWGFSESNTINPDVDDSTAALRAIHARSRLPGDAQTAWNRGLSWVVSMQNKDGGWPAFEKHTDKRILTWLAIDGAAAAAIDPSEADLTGRTIEYLANWAGLDQSHPVVQRGADCLVKQQERDGSWYGRWGICYIYGTWAALTGLRAAGYAPEHPSIRRGSDWLHAIQREDGGWGESCLSDQRKRYVPLAMSTPSQTAWALDALIAAHDEPTEAMKRGMQRLIELLASDDPAPAAYPTGAALPGSFYIRYDSYSRIWPLLALAHYRAKYTLK
ncbi:squalene-hopene cyclase [Paenibacillus sp. 598K]|uniref:squalene--hopene cyclase n=1 Tax=Paenibacillus sp. 598K TaxID=1117987 RepID=UPI000FF937C4|nr:squalene--hopene cyclase [Paenibacillus sp. 598K]GBF74288.1 squalene-hopene cyclase [Paenibacillus sp. 598K]